ncbi:hypothetical protein BU14_1607s0002 [Porphyra umbilicalis]|uniref:Uncharacterized protein n=1 Tax=Porphyra umbilicalis TaxID=2786 RepID=A0A1X6NL21_PORUM|nr:hypothetical protein BU14_1607s0002 [Porphyra umbilicalis]|eukprot:OSX69339.1 hypothetical protein BU14_1607s0002 [Porphyra umbilicalis]
MCKRFFSSWRPPLRTRTLSVLLPRLPPSTLRAPRVPRAAQPPDADSGGAPPWPPFPPRVHGSSRFSWCNGDVRSTAAGAAPLSTKGTADAHVAGAPRPPLSQPPPPSGATVAPARAATAAAPARLVTRAQCRVPAAVKRASWTLANHAARPPGADCMSHWPATRTSRPSSTADAV